MQAAMCSAVTHAPRTAAPPPPRCRRRSAQAYAAATDRQAEPALPPSTELGRRTLLGAGAGAALAAWACGPAAAVQGLIAGRIPGVTGPDAEGWYTYQRPEGKSGGHGVGWSELQRYKFSIPPGWEEVPVSIADLGGTELDLRYASKDEGSLQVVVAPVLRFRDVGTNADVAMRDLGPPDNIIAGFAPELFGSPLEAGEVLDTQVVERDGLQYYRYDLTKHRLVAATAAGNRVYILAARCNSVQWRRAGDKLARIRNSFSVPPKAADA